MDELVHVLDVDFTFVLLIENLENLHEFLFVNIEFIDLAVLTLVQIEVRYVGAVTDVG